MAVSNKMNLVGIDDAKTLIKINISATLSKNFAKRTNVCLHGSPGVGKSAIVAQVCEELGMRLIDIRLSAMEASDVLGIPYTHEGVMKFSTPEWWPDGSVPTVLFLDELKNAGPSVQTAAYRLILDRSIQNGKKLPDNCIIIAAGNLKEDKTGARDMLPAAANRFGMHLLIDRSKAAEPFLDYAVANKFNRHVIGYISWKKESIYGEIGKEEAFASPRTWEDVSNIMEMDFPSDYLRNIAIAGAVGSAEAMSFAGYMEYVDRLPDWNMIRTGDPSYTFKSGVRDMGFDYAIAVGVAFELLDAVEHGAEDECSRLCDAVVDSLPSDMVIVMFKTLKRDIKLAVRALSMSCVKQRFEPIRRFIK